MDYLSKMRFVHRDLAARNCMVNERAVVKVADFGLSRELMRRDYYRSDCSGSVPVPIRWLAPESLEANIFTTMSDVWSYGVLLWELMTRGAVPYSEVDNWQIASHVQHGNRLAQPPFCPDIIFGMIEKCWSNDPSTRPSFEQLVHWLDEVIASAKPGSRISSVLYQNITRGDDTAAASSASANSASASPSIIGGNFDAAGAQALRGVCD
jgi:serine/threonine protein kinase